MKKKIEEMTDRELLMELAAEKRLRDKLRYIKLGYHILLLTVVIVLGCIYIPKVVLFVNRVNEDLEQIENAISEIEDNVNLIKTYSFDAIDETLQKFSGSLEEFEKVITDLKENIELYNSFGQGSLSDTAGQIKEGVDNLKNILPFIN